MSYKITNRFSAFIDETNRKAVTALAQAMIVGKSEAAVLTPIDTSNLLNSSMIDVRQVGGKLIGIATYTADYAEAVHDPNHPQDFRRASARKEFLKQGFENAEPKMREILARTLKA